MKIALDFDNTYDRDRELWDRFIADCKQRGHTVIIVSCRRDSLAPKRHYCEQHRGCKFDIWIDDLPETITQGF